MKTALIVLAIAMSGLLFSQSEKGAIQISNPSSPTTGGTTRAVVVGISDYQSPQIPDLQFADSDAVAFADWLKSPAGGSVAVAHIALLTNGKATNGRISTALYWLLDESREGDTAIFYFSGHGDVEAKLRSQNGFLLAADSPPTNYIGNAVNLRDVQDVVSTLSIDRKVRVVLVTDACHAGKLAGSSVGGTQATAQALAQQFANEVKIMSCQPNEFSLEGKQWGGGRGLFSFHLLDGLTGEADLNSDGRISLFEIGRYLEDKVPADAAPHPQMPMTVGERSMAVSSVDAAALARLREERRAKADGLWVTRPKGVAAGRSPADSALWAAFEGAIDSGRFFRPEGRCAELFFSQLIDNQQLSSLHGLLKRNYAAALIDEVQQALNALLDNDPYEANNWKYNPSKYLEYPAYLQRAMDLLGEKHGMRRSLMAKKLYFEGYNLAKNIGEFEAQSAVRDSLKAAAKAKYLQSLAIEPGAAYVCYSIGSLYMFNVPIACDSMAAWMEKAVERSPSWLLPYLDAADEIQSSMGGPMPEQWLVRAKKWHPESYMLQLRLAWLNQWKDKPEESNAICRELIRLRPDLADAWVTMSFTQYFQQNDHEESIKSALRASELNPAFFTQNLPLAVTQPEKCIELCEKRWRERANSAIEKGGLIETMSVAMTLLRRFDEAEKLIDLMLKEGYGFTCPQVRVQSEKGRIRLLQNRLAEAEAELQKALDMDDTPDPIDVQTWALLGEVKAAQGKPAEAEAFFKMAMDAPYTWQQNAFKNEAHFLYGRFLLHQNRVAEAAAHFEDARKISPKTWHWPLGMALLSAQKGEKKAALDWLEKALDSHLFEPSLVLEEPLFSKIRKTRRFRELMEKSFPGRKG